MDFINNIISYFYTADTNIETKLDTNIETKLDTNIETKLDTNIETKLDEWSPFEYKYDELELIEYKEPSYIVNKYKYNNVINIINSNCLINPYFPTTLLNPSGIININKTRDYYKDYVKYYYSNNNKLISHNIFTDFYILNTDKPIVELYNQD